jgi:hypothetical protein
VRGRAANFPFANELNSMARQASAERAWSSISRFYENCKKSPRAERTPLIRGVGGMVFPSSSLVVARLSTKRQDGSLQIIENP